MQEILELLSPFLAVPILALPGKCLWSQAVSKYWCLPYLGTLFSPELFRGIWLFLFMCELFVEVMVFRQEKS